MSVKDDIKDLYGEYNDDKTALGELFTEMREDYDFYLGEQWKRIQKKKGKPYLTINLLKKPIDLLSGYHRQNKTDLKVYPVEGGDDYVADVHTQLIKWILSGTQFSQQLAFAFDDALIGGLGWIQPYMDYSNDVMDGDIKVIREDPFKIVWDPYTNTSDLSDCNRLFRRAYISKAEAKALFPDYAQEIGELPDGEESKLDTYTARSYLGKKGRINILEKWYRVTEDRKFFINVATMETGPVDDDFQTSDPAIQILTKKVQRIKMKRVAGDMLVLYDGPSPYLDDRYPFIPVFGTFMPTHPDWKLKLQGIVRQLKDLQYEKNKRRSQLMEFILTKNIKGYAVRTGSAIDINRFLSGETEVLELDNPDDIRELDGPKIPDAYVMLEKENNNDLLMVGPNADLMGATDGGSAASAPGVALQLRQRQGLVQVQGVFDNLSHAYEQLGQYIIELVNKNWSTEKIKRIVGENAPFVKEKKELERQAIQLNQMPVPPDPQAQAEFAQQGQMVMTQVQELIGKIDEFWADFDAHRPNARYDVRVGEVQSTPTYKLSVLSTLSELKHQGQNVPDEIFVEYLDLPKDMKDKWLEMNRAAQEGQAQAQQQAAQMQMEIEQLKADVKVLVEKMGNETDLEIAKLKAKDVYESKLEITKKGA